jgi:muramidase (phage lysozyme)
MTLNAKVELAGYTFQTGRDLVELQILLGNQSMSTYCMIAIADPGNVTAAALINHSLLKGGIQQLVDPEAKKQDVDSSSESVTSVTSGAEFDAITLAALDTVAWKETATPNTIAAYYSNNGVGSSQGSFTDQDIIDGGGFPKSAGTKYNVGRYQFNRGDWSDAKRSDSRIKGYSPKDQDLIALYKFQKVNRGWKELRAGAIAEFLKKAGGEWASIPGSPYGQVQANVTTKQYLDYYQERLAFRQKGKTETKTVNPKNKVQPVSPSTTDTVQPVVKGSIIKVTIGAYQYEFIHQATETSDNGTTTITGQGIRWLISRRKQSSTYKNTTLKQLATTICNEYNIKLDYQAKNNPEYIHIDQSGISDYKLLLREAEANGLFISENGTSMIIKDRAALGASTLVLAKGVNLISYRISDIALSGDEAPISSKLPQQAKTSIDPLTGKMVALAKDVTKGSKPTGKAKDRPSGTLKKGKEAQLVERAKTKRIFGLPSVFVLPLTPEHLSIQPSSVATTSDLPGCLGERVWVIMAVSHNLLEGTTTLTMMSPVEVLNIPKDKDKDKDRGTKASWIYPCTGTVTSLFSPNRNGKPHSGADIANVSGTPILAADDGVISKNSVQESGAGNFVQVRHNNADR